MGYALSNCQDFCDLGNENSFVHADLVKQAFVGTPDHTSCISAALIASEGVRACALGNTAKVRNQVIKAALACAYVIKIGMPKAPALLDKLLPLARQCCDMMP